ncbi:MAG: diaminopimelate epimerase [Nitrolancea sp.]
MRRLSFWKMSGAGNDFIVVDAGDLDGTDPSWLAQRICTRALSLGADGLILIEPVDRQHVTIHFYNPDGSAAQMCGNGSRCAARYAADHGYVDPGGFQLLTDSGPLDVIAGDGLFQVVMPKPVDLRLDFMEIEEAGERYPVHAVQIGVPHAVVVLPDVEQFSDADLTRIGRGLRHNANFPAGTNTNFVTIKPDGRVRQRTYERGVEALTKACGTGSTASAVVLTAKFRLDRPIELDVDGGRLRIDRRAEQLWLSGDARVIARGQLDPEALAW